MVCRGDPRFNGVFYGKLIVEVKSVDQIKSTHEAQLLTYMKLAGIQTGLLINFSVTRLKDGIKRSVL